MRRTSLCSTSGRHARRCTASAWAVTCRMAQRCVARPGAHLRWRPRRSPTWPCYSSRPPSPLLPSSLRRGARRHARPPCCPPPGSLQSHAHASLLCWEGVLLCVLRGGRQQAPLTSCSLQLPYPWHRMQDIQLFCQQPSMYLPAPCSTLKTNIAAAAGLGALLAVGAGATERATASRAALPLQAPLRTRGACAASSTPPSTLPSHPTCLHRCRASTEWATPDERSCQKQGFHAVGPLPVSVAGQAGRSQHSPVQGWRLSWLQLLAPLCSCCAAHSCHRSKRGGRAQATSTTDIRNMRLAKQYARAGHWHRCHMAATRKQPKYSY